MPAFRAASLEVAGICARSEAKARRVAAEHGILFATADLEALLARPEIALVSVTTPPATHLPFTEAALSAGTHVLCEKATALDAAEAEGAGPERTRTSRPRPERCSPTGCGTTTGPWERSTWPAPSADAGGGWTRVGWAGCRSDGAAGGVPFPP